MAQNKLATFRDVTIKINDKNIGGIVAYKIKTVTKNKHILSFGECTPVETMPCEKSYSIVLEFLPSLVNKNFDEIESLCNFTLSMENSENTTIFEKCNLESVENSVAINAEKTKRIVITSSNVIKQSKTEE